MIEQHKPSTDTIEFATLWDSKRYTPQMLLSVRPFSSVLFVEDHIRRKPAIVKRTRGFGCTGERHTPECCALAFEASMLRHLPRLGIAAPRYIELFHRDGFTHLVMEYVAAPTLEQVKASGHLTPADALQVVEEIAEVLVLMHDIGIVHQDAKPSNVLLPHGRPAMLIDWASAAYVRGPREQVRFFSFTPQVASDEQRAGYVLASNDIFILGRTLALIYPNPPWHVTQIIARATASLPRRFPDIASLRDAVREARQIESSRTTREHLTHALRSAEM